MSIEFSAGLVRGARAFVLALVFLPLAVFAQVEKGTVTGRVRDSSGAVVAHATVHIRNEASGITISAATNGDGLYVSPPLDPGAYEVEVEAPGFKSAVRHAALEVAQRVAVEINLAPGSATESVQVDATTVQYDTETSTVSNVRTEQAVHDLPLNGRDFTELLGLGAGVVPGQSQLTGSVAYVQQRGPSSYAINGQRMVDNRFLLDGIGDNENNNGLGIVIFPPIDAIEEFREETADADARYGRASGGFVNLAFRSGTKRYHGGVFDFFRNSDLDAKNYFDTGAKPGFRLNSFGATFGGPLFPGSSPRTFFFADYAGQRTSQGLTNVDTVPVWGPLGVGDFSLYTQTVHDPATGVAFPGNVVPASYLASPQSKVAQNVLALYTANGATRNIAGTTTANNFSYSPQRIDNSNAFDVRFDRQFTAADSGFLRYSQSNDNIVQPGILPAPLVGANTSGPAEQPAHQAVVSETHVFSPTKLDTVRFGWSRIFIHAHTFDAGLNLPTSLGIPGVIQPGDPTDSDGLPVFTISGATSIGDAANAPAQIGTNNYQVDDDFSWLRGRHAIDIGGELVRLQYNMYQTSAEHGTNSYTGNYTGLGLADLLLGAPTSGTYAYQAGTRGFRQLDLSFYVQDNYKVSDRLTLNLGLRYDNFLGWPWTEVRNRMYQFDPALSTTQVFQVGTQGIPRSGAQNNDLNFEPRIGLALRITPRTIFHAGYGIYDAAPNVNSVSGLSINAPDIDYWAFNNSAYGSAGFNYLSNGFAHTPPIGNAPSGSPLFAVNPLVKTPYSEQWHASLQRLLGSSTRFTVAYVGNVGRHLDALIDINQATPGTTAIATRRPYPYFAQIQQLQTGLVSSYNSLQVTAEQRAKNFNFLVSYTYSHALDQSSNSPGSIVNAYNPKADYGNSDQDLPNRLVGSVAYSLPFQGSAWSKPLVRGWQLNAIVSFSDGIPFSVLAGSNSLGVADGITPRAQLIGPGNGSLPPGQRTVQKWFNTAAFANPGAQQWGDAGRNILQGPGTKDVDFSVFRNIPLHESLKLQLRSEFFNLFNTPQFNNPNATVGNGFGTISSAGSPTTLQRISREIQLAAKVNF